MYLVRWSIARIPSPDWEKVTAIIRQSFLAPETSNKLKFFNSIIFDLNLNITFIFSFRVDASLSSQIKILIPPT